MRDSLISALYVQTNGVYFDDSRIDPWDELRDAKNFRGPGPVICHPPCQRWGRYWGGGPMIHNTPNRLLLGDDDQCFAHSLWAVRTFVGVLEHPEASHAWKYYGINKPPRAGTWVKADEFGGWTCCVAQGNYGHRSQKLTWLYAVNTKRPALKWGLCESKDRVDDSFRSAEDRRLNKHKRKNYKRMSKRQRAATPIEFKELLIELIK